MNIWKFKTRGTIGWDCTFWEKEDKQYCFIWCKYENRTNQLNPNIGVLYLSHNHVYHIGIGVFVQKPLKINFMQCKQWKERLNIDGHQFHQYYQNKQSLLILTEFTKHTTKYLDI